MINKSNMKRGLSGILIASALSIPAIANEKTDFERNTEQLETLTKGCKAYLENNPPSEHFKEILDHGMKDLDEYLKDPTKEHDVYSIGPFGFTKALEGRGRNSPCYAIPDALTNIANDEYINLRKN